MYLHYPFPRISKAYIVSKELQGIYITTSSTQCGLFNSKYARYFVGRAPHIPREKIAIGVRLFNFYLMILEEDVCVDKMRLPRR